MVIHSRFVVVTSTGAVQLWQLDRNQWTREESLAEIELAEFVELPEAKTISTRVGDDDESFVERVSRQISDAKVRSFPSFGPFAFPLSLDRSGFSELPARFYQALCDRLLCWGEHPSEPFKERR